MAVVAHINTNFTATTGDLEKGVKRVRSAVSRDISSIAAGTFGNINSALSAVRGLVAFQIGKRIAGAITGGLKALDISEAASNLGLAPDSLQSLSFAADQSGSSAEALQKSIAKMTDTIADAANGGEASQKAFQRLGLDFKQLRAQDVETNFKQIADAMSKASDAAARENAALDIFGRSGGQLITMFSEGAKGVQELQKEFHRLHGTVGELGFASVAAANDALQRVSVAFTGLKNHILVGATPGITLFADALANTTAAAFHASQGQFALSRSYLNFSKWAGNVLQKLMGSANDLEAFLKRRVGSAARSFGLNDFADWNERSAKAAEAQAGAARGQLKASDLLEQDWQRILKQMEQVRQRNEQLRKAGGVGEGAVTASGKAITPAAVERGSKEAFDIIAKAIGADKADAIPKQQLDVAKKQHHTLEEIERRLNDPKLVLAEANLS